MRFDKPYMAFNPKSNYSRLDGWMLGSKHQEEITHIKRMERYVLSIEQMQNLKDFGVKIKTPSFYWIRDNEGARVIFDNDNYCSDISCTNPLPTIAIQDMLEMLPNTIWEHFDLDIQIFHGGWKVMYYDYEVCSSLFSIYEDELLEALYKTLIWLGENKLLKQ